MKQISTASTLYKIILFNFLLLSITVYSQNFEGKITTKDITVKIIALDDLIYGDEDYNEESYSEEDYNEEENEEWSLNGPQIPKEIIEKYFSLSTEEMREAVNKYKSEIDDDYMENDLFIEATSEIFIKGSKMRADTQEEGMKISMLIDTESPIAKIIRWDKKVVINMDLDKMRADMDAAVGNYDYNIQAQNSISLIPTGETKEINGFICELYKGTNSENSYEHAWLSKSVDKELISSFSKMSELFAQFNSEDEDSELEFYMNNNSIPILSKKMSGSELIQIEEILNIEKITIDPLMFKNPKGLREMDMAEMMRQGFIE